ncbi:MAG: CHAD domain-containing protein [Solirubrobacteraceae bacterium]|nr:MAG: hypothetical protein DLM63_07215 [Solirubrobacterales bacterium]
MAKASHIRGLQATDPLRLAAARVLEVRIKELFAQARGVLDINDIERVHDMRVASRRLRSVLEIFAPCFPAVEHRAALRDVKSLADALGERRDPDVQIAGLRTFKGAVGRSDQPGVEHLIERFRAQQRAGNARLETVLAETQASDLRGRLEALVEAARAESARREGQATA